MAEGESHAQNMTGLYLAVQHCLIHCRPSTVRDHNGVLHICSSVMYNIMYSDSGLSGLHF